MECHDWQQPELWNPYMNWLPETGSVCANWMQYNLIKKYLEVMTDHQTLVVESGHPVGLFKSKPEITCYHRNGLLVGEYDNERLGNCRRNGCHQLRSNDMRRLDIHRPTRYRPWYFQHPPSMLDVRNWAWQMVKVTGKLFISSGSRWYEWSSRKQLKLLKL